MLTHVQHITEPCTLPVAIRALLARLQAGDAGPVRYQRPEISSSRVDALGPGWHTVALGGRSSLTLRGCLGDRSGAAGIRFDVEQLAIDGEVTTRGQRSNR